DPAARTNAIVSPQSTRSEKPTRLDSSTNWAVVTTGIALSATYSSAEASPLPMVLVGLLVSVFLLFEARLYRYFDVWPARARLLETYFYAPMWPCRSFERKDIDIAA